MLHRKACCDETSPRIDLAMSVGEEVTKSRASAETASRTGAPTVRGAGSERDAYGVAVLVYLRRTSRSWWSSGNGSALDWSMRREASVAQSEATLEARHRSADCSCRFWS